MPVLTRIPTTATNAKTFRLAAWETEPVAAITFRGRLIDALLSPPAPGRGGQIALTCLRILVGLIWLRNVLWKVPPDFGEARRAGLYFWSHLAIDHPVFPPYSWLVEHLVLPNFTLFGWGVLVVESLLAVLLLTGTAVRLAGLLGVAQSIAIGLSVAAAPNEWPWAYAMMIGIHAILVFAPSAQYAAVDALRAGTTTSARRLLGGWGVVLAVIGLLAIWNRLRDRPAVVGVPGLEFSVGEYNWAGALVLLGIAVAMFTGAMLSQRVIALAAAVVAAVAAATIYSQFGRTEVWLGGTASAAVVFACAAVISVAAAIKIGQDAATAPARSDDQRSGATEGC